MILSKFKKIFEQLFVILRFKSSLTGFNTPSAVLDGEQGATKSKQSLWFEPPLSRILAPIFALGCAFVVYGASRGYQTVLQKAATNFTLSVVYRVTCMKALRY